MPGIALRQQAAVVTAFATTVIKVDTLLVSAPRLVDLVRVGIREAFATTVMKLVILPASVPTVQEAAVEVAGALEEADLEAVAPRSATDAVASVTLRGSVPVAVGISVIGAVKAVTLPDIALSLIPVKAAHHDRPWSAIVVTRPATWPVIVTRTDFDLSGSR